ncbi:hypothetical protein AYO21_08664 [Fonsecaea monophora]|uniref:ABM domain-containing protein n=1 Tax=Fonsecaea monophora TaxID=254056 RepID=A0A177F1P4_9EURO|nr:hypothetical protein AYO21_08664 [Fonsecaea monophora]OAG37129.1 hypothetical protein AYO21_08664 [Fonsecaea monophora]
MYIITLSRWESEAGKSEILLETLRAYVESLDLDALSDMDVFVLKGQKADNLHVFYTLLAQPEEKVRSEDKVLEDVGYSGLQEQCLRQNLVKFPVANRRLKSWSGFLYRPDDISPRSFAVVAELEYKEGKRAEGEPFWEAIAKHAEANEAGTYSYLWSRDRELDHVLWSFERYESEEYLWKTHVEANELVQRSSKLQKDIRGATRHMWLECQCCLVQKKYYEAHAIRE